MVGRGDCRDAVRVVTLRRQSVYHLAVAGFKGDSRQDNGIGPDCVRGPALESFVLKVLLRLTHAFGIEAGVGIDSNDVTFINEHRYH